MVILVTGSEGFIGKHLCARLLKDGHEVLKVDKKTNCDLCNTFRWGHDEVDVVFHLAAKTGLLGWGYYPEYQRNNETATFNLLNNVRVRKKFILTSTSSVYGYDADCDEEQPTKPVSPYGVTKLAQEELCKTWLRVNGLPLTILRLFSVYGPGQREDMAIARFMRAAVTGETVQLHANTTRGVTYIDDVIEALVLAMDGPDHRLYNVGGRRAVTPLCIVDAINELCSGSEYKLNYSVASTPRLGDQRVTLADTSGIRRELGWEPKVTFCEGIRRQWEAYINDKS